MVHLSVRVTFTFDDNRIAEFDCVEEILQEKLQPALDSFTEFMLGLQFFFFFYKMLERLLGFTIHMLNKWDQSQ